MRRLLAPAVLLAILLPPLGFLLAEGPGATGEALRNSLVTAAAAAALATAFGVPAGIGLAAGFRGRGAVALLLALPLLLPPAIPAAALLLAGERLGPGWGLGGGRPATALWHALLAAPLVAALVFSALSGVEARLLRAAEACGADPALAARRLLRPRLWPAMGAGAALAFALSAGESGVAAVLGAGTLAAESLPGGTAAGTSLAALLAAGALLLAVLLRPGRGGEG